MIWQKQCEPMSKKTQFVRGYTSAHVGVAGLMSREAVGIGGASLEEVFEIAPAIKVSCFAECAIVNSVHKV